MRGRSVPEETQRAGRQCRRWPLERLGRRRGRSAGTVVVVLDQQQCWRAFHLTWLIAVVRAPLRDYPHGGGRVRQQCHDPAGSFCAPLSDRSVIGAVTASPGCLAGLDDRVLAAAGAGSPAGLRRGSLSFARTIALSGWHPGADGRGQMRSGENSPSSVEAVRLWPAWWSGRGCPVRRPSGPYRPASRGHRTRPGHRGPCRRCASTRTPGSGRVH